ncbi:MAG: hypothetical protein LBH00_08770 [Planctomycetaceae bacterium]|jgi:type II secretory pathway component GspD/PulD (secretin)|nr:hypothetical protein [Planctomycetaceae bacterium]
MGVKHGSKIAYSAVRSKKMNVKLKKIIPFLGFFLAVQPVFCQITPEQPVPAAPKPPSEVVVTATPAGLMLTSNDPETLNKIEEIIRMLADESVLGKTSMEVYYLKNSTAEVVAQSLQSLMGSGTSALGVSGAGSVNLPAWQQTELAGLFAAAGSSIEKTGTVSIAADARLNALYVQANPVDHKTITKLLKVLDQPSRDDIMNRPRPRLVAVRNIRAEEAKTVVETVYANRMQGNGGNAGGGMGNRNNDNNRNRNVPAGGAAPQPMMMPGMPPGMPGMPPGMMQQFLAQAGGTTSTSREQEAGMTLGIDARSNSLIVSASEALFLEVEAFVKELDDAALNREMIVERVALANISPNLARQTLTSIFGSAVTFGNENTNRSNQQQTGFAGTGNAGNNAGMFGGGTNRQFGNFGGNPQTGFAGTGNAGNNAGMFGGGTNRQFGGNSGGMTGTTGATRIGTTPSMGGTGGGFRGGR